ncbi:hypothetical protein QA641_33385 [Bradyrhizobium sp. CB1650]|uniref:hypothetical protein n=1 Tax=Bradyrhizobium sp. CB1650 TaxID=3039153 RepID=UPI00243604A5|nr:hypothetical protein [Bradyrhizobium sp. CB1650]WGD50448.1 hypothetical protein QA641_33385 [Bradyrhizobium sp. CB1650]
MPDAELTSLLRAVLDEVCADVPLSAIATRERVAAKLREAVQSGRCLPEDLRQVGRDALTSAPTMWR